MTPAYAPLASFTGKIIRIEIDLAPDIPIFPGRDLPSRGKVRHGHRTGLTLRARAFAHRCRGAHRVNFGMYGTPERNLVSHHGVQRAHASLLSLS